MNRRKPITARQLAREKLLFRYSSALERGDFDTLAAILRLAETDPLLEKMLMEMDIVYRAEIAPLPALPMLSAHHNHRHTREDETMNTTYPTITRRLPDSRSRGRWNSAATLAAAMIALVLFAGILISRRPPTDPQQGNPGIVMQNETATPIPSLTATPAVIAVTPLLTFTPTAVDASATFLPTPVQDAGIISTLCGGVVSNVTALEGTGVFTQPGFGGVLVGYLSETTMVAIMVQEIVSVSDYPGLWYYVRTQGVDGWISAQFIIPTSTCPSINVVDASDCAITPVALLPTFTPTWTPTPAPGLQVEPVDSIFAAATTVVDYATAMAQASMLQPTIVPPCVILGPGTFIPPTIDPGTVMPSIPLDRYIFYTVQFGDTLLSLITTYSITLEEIAFLNPELVFNTCDFTLQDGGINCNILPPPGETIKLPFMTIPINATPTAMFDGALGSGFYAAITNQTVGNIPAGTPVQIGSAFYNGVEWNYNIIDQSGRQNTARESQLDFASDYTPGMATPTAAYFDLRDQVLITLVQVGAIPANTPVQATSGYYNGTEWVYGVMTLDGSAFADIPASQLQAVSLGQAGIQPTLVPTTYPPTFTPTPFS